MINPEKNLAACCLMKFQSPFSKRQAIQSPTKFQKAAISKHNKVSLKNYASPRHLKVSQLTKLPSQQPETLDRSIIQKLTSFDDHNSTKLNKIKQHNPFINYTIQNPHYLVKQTRIQKPPTLAKAKSLTKVSFSYHSEQFKATDSLQSQYRLVILPRKGQNSTENLKNLKKEIPKSSIKYQDEQDMRSTMQPSIEPPKMTIRKPKSIISINDEEDMQDFMKESLIIEKHSSTKAILRLV